MSKRITDNPNRGLPAGVLVPSPPPAPPRTPKTDAHLAQQEANRMLREANLLRLRNLPPEEREVKQDRPKVPYIPSTDTPDGQWRGTALTLRPAAFGAMVPPGVTDFSHNRLTQARRVFFERHAEELLEYFVSRANWAARRKPTDLSTHAEVEEFFTDFLARHGEEKITVRGLAGYPDEFDIEFEKLGTFAAQLDALRMWVNVVRMASADALPDVTSDAADEAFGTIMNQLAEAKLLPEIAERMGWPLMGLGKFLADYVKKYGASQADLMLAYDMGLQSLTAETAHTMASMSARGTLTNQNAAVLQARLANYRTLGTRLAGSSYAAPAAQRQSVSVQMPSGGGGMRIDIGFDGGRGDDIDVLAHLPVIG